MEVQQGKVRTIGLYRVTEKFLRSGTNLSVFNLVATNLRNTASTTHPIFKGSKWHLTDRLTDSCVICCMLPLQSASIYRKTKCSIHKSYRLGNITY
jgi:hypothetical protein